MSKYEKIIYGSYFATGQYIEAAQAVLSVFTQMSEEINGRINFSALSVESGYFDMYQKFLDCPDVDVTQTLIWLIECIITDIFTKSYQESIKRMESSIVNSSKLPKLK